MGGANTKRSLENFKISNNKMPNEIIIALGHTEKSMCIYLIIALGLISKKVIK